MESENIQKLSREQKKAIGLLSIGSFLEYFDLMLYVHMAVFLNAIFFKPTDPWTSSLLGAFAFCSTFIARPIGAAIFGYIGDNIGRKSTITITTFLMAGCCFMMTVIPTYAQIGIAASFLITACRIVQGISSMGELMGAELYAAEIIKYPPLAYASVACICAFATLGTLLALLVATAITSFGLNWRYAFGFGMIIALIGGVARQELRETPDFIDAKRRIKLKIDEAGINSDMIDSNPVVKEKVETNTFISLFFMDCGWPVAFYIVYFYCSTILRDKFHYTPGEIIQHNLIVGIVNCFERFLLTYLAYRIYPLKILKFKWVIYTITILVLPYILTFSTSPIHILLIQMVIIAFGPTKLPTLPIVYKYIPVFKRFKVISFTYALGTALVYIITSFGLIEMTRIFGYWGIIFIVLPGLLLYKYGVGYFEKLERESGRYPK
jgi:MHS family proline/betaine transporter-like MFS transporter